MTEPDEHRKITVSREFSVAAPQSERAYPIPASEWGRLKKAISRIAPHQNWYQAGGWLFAGVCVTTLISWLASDHTERFGRPGVVEWVAIISGGLIALVLLFVDSQQRKSIAETAQSIVEDMSHIEEMFVPDATQAEERPDASVG